MLKELLVRQNEYTSEYFESLNLQDVEKVLELLLKHSGICFFTGVGKSGLVAKKIALTMVSTGTRALYLSPTDAVHGDLGMVSVDDLFILFSKSGESDELLRLIPAIRNKGAILISVVCNAQSRLARASDYTILLPVKRELCPFDMAPTTSTTIQLMFGDLLSVALMERKKFSLDQYALNHPSGRIGKRMTLKVKDLMLTGSHVPLCQPDYSLSEGLVELSNKRCGCVLIINKDQQLQGIFTDGDLRRALQKHGSTLLSKQMHEVMNDHPLWIHPHTLAWEAMKIMETDPHRRVMMLPVLDNQHQIVGLLHMHDIVQSGL